MAVMDDGPVPMSTPPLAPGYHSLASGHIATIVTFLEMNAPPSSPRPAPFDTLAVTRWRDVEIDPYLTLFRAVGTDWLWASRLVIPEAELQTILEDTRTEIYRLDRAGAPIGLLELNFREEGACEIAFFGLVPGAVGQSIGPWFMSEALRLAWREGIERVWLHTCTLDHPKALGFYQSCGFKPYAQEVEVMVDPRVSGVLPKEAGKHVLML